MLTAARFWPQRWLAVGTMPQDLIGCWNQRKLKVLISLVVVFVNDPPSAKRNVDFAVFFIVLWSYGSKICLNMCHGKLWKFRKFIWLFISSQDLLYLRNYCECIAELNPSASCWPLTRCFLIYQQTSANQNTVHSVHLKSGFIWKFSREWLFWTGYARGRSLRKKPQSPTVIPCKQWFLQDGRYATKGWKPLRASVCFFDGAAVQCYGRIN